MTFGNLLKKSRISNSLTQMGAARLMNISQSTYSRLESDKQAPSLYHLKKTRECFDISVDQFLDHYLEENHKD